MNEPAVPVSRLGAYTLWSMTGMFLVSAWIVYLFNLADLGVMLATTACVSGLGASTLSVRCYALKVARLVRLTGGLPTVDSRSSLRSVHE